MIALSGISGIFTPTLANAMAASSKVPVVTSIKASQNKYTNKITVTWSKAENDNVDSYAVFRKGVYETKWKKIATVDNDVNKYVDSAKGATKYYNYKILAKNIDGTDYKSKSTKTKSATGWCKVTICIDPGHTKSENNNGAKGSAWYSEAEAMLSLGKKLNKQLNALNISTKMTRTGYNSGNVDITDLQARGRYSKGCNYFIALHTNATSDNSWNVNINNIAVFANQLARSGDDYTLAYELGANVTKAFKSTGIKPFVKNVVTFSDTLNDSISSYGRVYFRNGDNGKDYYGVLRASTAVGTPGVLIEHSYHVNPVIRTFLNNSKNLDKVAKAEAQTIAKHYGFPTE